MKLFYAPSITLPLYTLSEEESRHCVRVLRLSVGDDVSLTDGRGNLYRAVVESADQRQCRVRVVETVERFEQLPYRLTVAVAPTKNTDRMEWFVEKAVEVGITRIVPLSTDHGERPRVNIDRLEKIAISAIKQSLKAYLPVIDPLTPFDRLIEAPFDGVKLIAHCEANGERTFFGSCVGRGDDVLILIGPEGDFSAAEIESACRAGFGQVTLGNQRLRTETAALVATVMTAFINS